MYRKKIINIIKNVIIRHLFLLCIVCVNEEPTVNDNFVNISLIGFDTIIIRNTIFIEGNVDVSPAINEQAFLFNITDTIGNNMNDDFILSFDNIEKKKDINLKNDLNLQISSKENSLIGYYRFKMTVTSGNLDSSEDFVFLNKPADSIEIILIPFDTINPDTIKNIEGTIKAYPPIDEKAFLFNVTDSNGINVNSEFVITYNDMVEKAEINLKNDLDLSISADTNNVSFGKYTFEISVTSGSITSEKEFSFFYTPKDSVEISIIPFDSLIPCRTTIIKGTVKTHPAVDETAFSFNIIDSIGTNMNNKFIIRYNDIDLKKEIDLQNDLGLAITPILDIKRGNYSFNIKVIAGHAASSKDVSFQIYALLNVDVTLGSFNSATYGASLDADKMIAYKAADALPICEKIDIWYSNDVDSNDVFYSPKEAAKLTFTPYQWNVQNETKMATISTEFDSIVLQIQIDSIWNTVQDSDKKQLLQNQPNDIIILETDQLNKCLIKFISGDGTPTGKAIIQGKLE